MARGGQIRIILEDLPKNEKSGGQFPEQVKFDNTI